MRVTYTELPRVLISAAASLLVVALANTMTASALPGSNTVTSGDIVSSAVGSSEIKSGAVNSSEINADAVGSSEIRANAVGSSELADDITVTSLTAESIFAARIFNTDFLNLGNSIITPIADNGVASTPTAFTLDNVEAYAFLGLDCLDADGCDVTLEQDFTDGDVMFVYNAGSNAVNFADTVGQSELAGNFAMGQWDTLQVIFRDDTVTNSWIEVSRSDN